MGTDRTQPAARADLVVRGGLIRTLDDTSPVTDALAIRQGCVVAHGDSATSLIGPSTRVVELNGRTAIPGVNDAHLHGAWLGARWPHLFFGEHSHDAPEGRLVTNEAQRRDALHTTWRLLASLGITSYTEPGIGPGEDGGETGCFGSDILDTYVALHRAGAQTARVTLLRLFGVLDGPSHLEDLERGLVLPAPDTDPRWLAIPGVKIFADGIPPMCTAWVREPYVDGTVGSLLTAGGESPVDAYQRMIAAAHTRGLQVAVHATGDRAIEEFVAELERLGTRRGPDDAPHYVVHGDLATPDLLRRMAALGVGVAVQPLIAAHTHAWASAQLGPDRTRRAWPLAEMFEAGVLTTVTSDAPIATPDWRQSWDSAVRLLTDAGQTDDSVVRERLLRAITVDAARQDGAARWKGTLATGMAADVCILDEDPLESGRGLTDVAVATTIVDGRVVFEQVADAADPLPFA